MVSPDTFLARQSKQNLFGMLLHKKTLPCVLSSWAPNPGLGTVPAIPEVWYWHQGWGAEGQAATLTFMGTNSSLNYESSTVIHSYKSTNETHYHPSGMNSLASFHQAEQSDGCFWSKI